MPRSAKEVQEMIRNDIEKHLQFVISGVTMNWDEDILSVIDVAFILEVPAEEWVKRVQHREEVRFGSRVMSGGDMYEQQKAFREIIGNRSNERVEESANRLHCKKVRLDGTKSIVQLEGCKKSKKRKDFSEKSRYYISVDKKKRKGV